MEAFGGSKYQEGRRNEVVETERSFGCFSTWAEVRAIDWIYEEYRIIRKD